MKRTLIATLLFASLCMGIGQLRADFPWGYECRMQCYESYQFCHQAGWPNCFAQYDACLLGCDL